MLDMSVATDSSMSGFGAVWSEDYVVGSWKEYPQIYADVVIQEGNWAQGPSIRRVLGDSSTSAIPMKVSDLRLIPFHA